MKQGKRTAKRLIGSILAVLTIMSIVVISRAEKVQAYEVSGFYQYEFNDTGVTITKYTGGEFNVNIPSKIAGKNVTVIGDYAFNNNDIITGVKIPGTVTKIAYEAFIDCDNLVEINVPNSVTVLENSVFYSCDNLTKVVVGNSVKNIGSYCFKNCAKLNKVEIGKNVQYIGEEAFSNCSSLDNMVIPSSVKKIDNYAFSNCDGLTTLTISEGLEEIAYEAFIDCDNLVEINIPNSVTVLENSIFYSCDNLTKAVIGNGVKSISSYCFKNCTKLNKAEIGKNVQYIGEEAFSNCSSLDNMVIPASVKKIDNYAFSNCDGLTTLTISEGLEEIAYEAFIDCDNLVEINIPNSVTVIENSVFYSCDNLMVLQIPNSVTSIGSYLINNSKNAVIYGYANSAAEAYAIENKYPFVELPAMPSTGFTFGKKEISLDAGQQADIDYTINPETTTDAIAWVSSNPDIANVDNIGHVTAKAPGSVSIIATTTSGLKQNLTVIVNEAPKSITFKYPSRMLTVGKSFTQKALLDNGQRTDVTVTYSSSNTAVATVNAAGKVTAKKAGTATITAHIFNGLEVSCLVTVKTAPASVALGVKNIVLGVQKSYQLTPRIPAGSYTSKYTYKSSNTSVAVVNGQGRILTKKKGVTVITVTTDNGKKAACKVTVK